MGDTVVFEDEITPAMDAAFEAGLEVTALHNHFIFDEPKVYFMHIGGQANAEKLATGVKRVWDAIKEVRAKQPEPAKRIRGDVSLVGKIDASVIEKILKTKSETRDGVVKVTIGREGMMHGVKLSGSMGLTTWAAFRQRQVRGRRWRLYHDGRGGAAGLARSEHGEHSCRCLA